jgi:hypothetical protein
MPTGLPNFAVAAGSENIRFIGTPTTLAGTISGVGVVCIGSPVVGVPSDPSPIRDGGVGDDVNQNSIQVITRDHEPLMITCRRA